MITQTRIVEWYQYYKGQVYISFSGGKDSTVLLDIARRIYPNIEGVFVDTGLEYPEIREFVKSKKNIKWLEPEMRFDKVIKNYGYPLISKEAAKNIEYGRKALFKGDMQKFQRYVNGLRKNKKTGETYYYMGLSILAKRLFESNIPVSNKCCTIMKKKPVKKYEKETKKTAIIGTMASESKEREFHWIKNGCNSFLSKRPISKPMSFWVEEDILNYIDKYKIPYASIYGDIKFNDQTDKYECTGVNRTGCIFCGFGCHLEKSPNRFQLLKNTHPKQWDYCIRPTEENGLGMGKVLDFMNVPYSGD